MKNLLFTCALMLSPLGIIIADERVVYPDYNEAMRAAYKFREAGNWADAENALDQAVTMAPDMRKKSEVHQILLGIYAKTDRPQLMFESTEFVAKNHPHPASISLTIDSMLTSVRRLDWQQKLTTRYEEVLQENPKDRVALTIMEKYEYLVVRDHAKRREYIERLIALDDEEGKGLNSNRHRDRAFSLRLERKFDESAEAYEAIAQQDETSRSYSLMFAAENWQRAKNKDRASVAAKRADEIGPDVVARKNLYQWHRGLGEVFLYLHERELAVKHLRAAVEDAPIDAYREQCAELLELANALN